MLFAEIALATQLYLPFSPTIVSSNESFNSYNNADDISPSLNVNVENYTYQVQEQTLQMVAQRKLDYDISLYDVQQIVNVPLRQDLRLKYSIFASQLDVNSSSIRVYLALTNTTHVLVLGYHVGRVEADRISEPSAPNYMYAFFQIDNRTNAWIKGDRNIFQDIQAKGISINDDGWTINRLYLGFWSYEKGSETSYTGYFNLNETSLFYENLVNVQVTPNSPRFSWPIAFMMIVDLFLVAAVLLFARRSKPRGSM